MSDPLPATLVDPPPALGPERRPEAWDEARVRAAIDPTDGTRTADLRLALALLWHDHHDAAHALAQAHEGDRDADWLHAILHRREPDPGNARYWYGHVGAHPAFPALAAQAKALGLGDALAPGGRWRPEAMIAACEHPGGRLAALVALQAAEFRLLAGRLAR